MQPYSKSTLIVLSTLAGMIKIARIERKMSQADLAKRLDVSRLTVIALEKGDAKVSIGTVIEAAVVVGVPLLGEDFQRLKSNAKLVENMCSLLPQRSGRNKKDLDDDF